MSDPVLELGSVVPDLRVPSRWAVTPDGMTCDGLHALDLWVGLDAEGVPVIGLAGRPGGRIPAPPLEDEDGDPYDPAPYSRWVFDYLEQARGLDLEGALGPEQTTLLREYLNELLPPPVPLSFGDVLASWRADEARRDPLGIVDLGEVMRDGVERPRMLECGRIVAGRYQSWTGPKESAKTWAALDSAAKQLRLGRCVVWIDKEMGRADLAERLVTLGVSPNTATELFVYMEYPALNGEDTQRAHWDALLKDRRPVAIFADAHVEVLADAGLNEDKATDVTRWGTWYVQPALRLSETAFVMLDHTGHDEQGRARGSSAKGTGVRLELGFKVTRKFDRATVGQLEVTVNKNALAADIPKVQRFRVGGDPFVFEPDDSLPADPGGAEAGALWQRRLDVEKLLREDAEAGGAGKTLNFIKSTIGGNTAKTVEALAALVDSSVSGVATVPNPRRPEDWVLYTWRAMEPGDETPGATT